MDLYFESTDKPCTRFIINELLIKYRLSNRIEFHKYGTYFNIVFKGGIRLKDKVKFKARIHEN